MLGTRFASWLEPSRFSVRELRCMGFFVKHLVRNDGPDDANHYALICEHSRTVFVATVVFYYQTTPR